MVWGLGAFYILDCHKIKNIDQKKAIMSGHMKKCGNGNTVRSKKVGLGHDKSWADPNGSDAVMKRRKKLREKLLRKKESEVGGQNGKDAIAINEENPWKEFVEEKVIEPVKEFIVKV